MTALWAGLPDSEIVRDAILSVVNGPLGRGTRDEDRIDAARWDIENHTRFEHPDVVRCKAEPGGYCDTCRHIGLANLADAEAGR